MSAHSPTQPVSELQSLPDRPRGSSELTLSFLVIAVLSALYVAYELLADPRGSHPVGHSLGIVGTLLMLMTEVLYSLRKRTRLLNWAGPVRHWLSFHIFTGIVGPFLVLMHTGLMFRGLAGLSMLLTVIVVLSGFVGRYLFTALPRALTGAASSRRAIAAEATQVQNALERFQAQRPDAVRRLVAHFNRRTRRQPILLLFGRSFYQWRYRQKVNRAIRRLDQLEEEQRRRLSQLLGRKRELDVQIEVLQTARRTLRYWHIIHVPLGLTLFFSVAIHIIATLYFRAGLFR